MKTLARITLTLSTVLFCLPAPAQESPEALQRRIAAVNRSIGEKQGELDAARRRLAETKAEFDLARDLQTTLRAHEQDLGALDEKVTTAQEEVDKYLRLMRIKDSDSYWLTELFFWVVTWNGDAGVHAPNLKTARDALEKAEKARADKEREINAALAAAPPSPGILDLETFRRTVKRRNEIVEARVNPELRRRRKRVGDLEGQLAELTADLAELQRLLGLAERTPEAAPPARGEKEIRVILPGEEARKSGENLSVGGDPFHIKVRAEVSDLPPGLYCMMLNLEPGGQRYLWGRSKSDTGPIAFYGTVPVLQGDYRMSFSLLEEAPQLRPVDGVAAAVITGTSPRGGGVKASDFESVHERIEAARAQLSGSSAEDRPSYANVLADELIALASLHIRVGNHVQARELILNALPLMPAHPYTGADLFDGFNDQCDGLEMLATVLYHEGDVDGMSAAYEQLVDHHLDAAAKAENPDSVEGRLRWAGMSLQRMAERLLLLGADRQRVAELLREGDALCVRGKGRVDPHDWFPSD